MDRANERPWRPLVDEAAAAPVRAAIEDIARALELPAHGPLLVGGAAGRALLFGYLASAWRGCGFEIISERHLEQAVEQLPSFPLSPSLFGGFAGVAWAVEHLSSLLPRQHCDDTNRDIDEVLFASLRVTPWLFDFDLVSGLCGYGVYALERSGRAIGRACLAEVVVRLDELAQLRPVGLTWHSAPELLIPETRALYPDGYDNLGVAHGAPAAALVLAGACALGVERERSSRLLQGVMAWMFAQRHAEGPSSFPRWIDANTPWTPARSAWCYGDPGVATCLFAAARAVGESGWERDALTVARRAAVRAIEDCGVRDAGLCHGSAGLLLLYQRLWHATGDELFADAARRWLARTLEFREPGRGVGGFRSFGPPLRPPFSGEPVWQDDPSLLTGSAGIALALLAAVSSVEPAWDRLLAVSLPDVCTETVSACA